MGVVEWRDAIDKEGDLVGVRVIVRDTYEVCDHCVGKGCKHCQQSGFQPSCDYELVDKSNKLIGMFGD